jgi:hypothetical protein
MDQADNIAPKPQAAGPLTTVPAGRPAAPTPVSRADRVPLLAWVIGVVFVAVELAVSGRSTRSASCGRTSPAAAS